MRSKPLGLSIGRSFIACVPLGAHQGPMHHDQCFVVARQLPQTHNSALRFANHALLFGHHHLLQPGNRREVPQSRTAFGAL